MKKRTVFHSTFVVAAPRRTAKIAMWCAALLAGGLLFGLPASAQIDPFSKVGFEPTDAIHQIGNDTINPLTGLLVRNETIMGPFTAPHGYQYSIVAHYSGPNWRAYFRVGTRDGQCYLEELHRCDGLGALGYGWTLHMGVLHATNKLLHGCSFESPTGELIYFHPEVEPSYPDVSNLVSTDGRYRLIRTTVWDNQNCIPVSGECPEGCAQQCGSHNTFTMYGPDGTQYFFQTHASRPFDSNDVTAFAWSDYYVNAIKTMTGDVITITYEAPVSVLGGNWTNILSIADGTRVIDFHSENTTFTSSYGKSKNYFLIKWVRVSDVDGSTISFTYDQDAYQSPLGATKLPNVDTDYHWNEDYLETVLKNPRPRLRTISLPESMALDYTYEDNHSGFLASAMNPYGGLTSYEYQPLVDPGTQFTDVLGVTLNDYKYGKADFPCPSQSEPYPSHQNGAGSKRQLALSMPDSLDQGFVEVDLVQPSQLPPGGGPQWCSGTIYLCMGGLYFSCTPFTYTWVCGEGGGSGGGGNTCVPPSQYIGWNLRQTTWYSVYKVNRNEAVWEYSRPFDTTKDPSAPRRIVKITNPGSEFPGNDASVEVIDYGGVEGSLTLENLTGANTDNSDENQRAKNLQYLVDYMNGKPRSRKVCSKSCSACWEDGTATPLLETRYLYDGKHTCWANGSGIVFWTLDKEGYTRAEATRAYDPSSGFTEILTHNQWDSSNKAIKDQNLYFRKWPPGSAATSDAEMETPGTGWTQLQSTHTEFDPIVDIPATGSDPDSYWLLGRVKKLTTQGGSLFNTGTRATEYITNGRGQVILEKVAPSATETVYRRFFFDHDGQVHRAAYSRDGIPAVPYTPTAPPPSGAEPPLASWNKDDTWNAASLPGGAPAASKVMDIDYDQAFPLALKWRDDSGSYPYSENTRTWNATRGLATKDVDANGVETTYGWDNLDRLSNISQSHQGTLVTISNITWTTVSGSAWTDAYVTDGCGGESHHLYDGFGRLRESWTKYPKSSTDTSWSVVAQTYDGMGRLHEKTEPFEAAYRLSPPFHDIQDKSKTTYTYDALGRVTDVSGPAGFHQTIAYDGLKKTVTTEGIQGEDNQTLSRTTSYSSDPLGRLILVDEPEGADAVYAYNVAGQLTEARTGEGLPAGALASYLQSGPAAVTFPTTQVRSFHYDDLGRLTSETHPESGTTEYTSYDPLGNLLSYQDEKGRAALPQYSIAFSYDYKGRKTGIALGQTDLAKWYYDEEDDGDNPPSSFGFSKNRLTRSIYHNFEGGLVTGLDKAVEERFRYNQPFARLGHKDMRILGHNDYYLDYNYNSCGQETAHNAAVGPAGQQAYFTALTGYRAGMISQSVMMHEIPRGVGQVHYAPSLGMAGWTYMNSIGQVSVAHEAQSSSTNPSRIQSITLSGHSSWTTGTYAYDGAGNIKSIGPAAIANTYTYDALSRLKTSHVTHGSDWAEFGYTYDPFGNLTARNFVNTSADSDISNWIELQTQFARQATESSLANTNRLTEVRTGGGYAATASCNKTMAYDANGNMKSIIGCQNPAQTELGLTYDPLNRLAKAEPLGYYPLYYYYNADGERVAMVQGILPAATSCEATYYLRSGPQLAAQEYFRYLEGATVTNLRKGFLYLGNNLVATEEWEEALDNTGEGQGGNTTNSLSRVICPGSYARRAGLRTVVGLSDPIVTAQSNQNYQATSTVQNISSDLVGLMVRFSRLKPQGNGGGSGENGNGEPKDDEDKVECLYYLVEGADANFVFRRFGLAQNQDYGSIQPLASGGSGLAAFSDLHSDKIYRMTLYAWTTVGADPNLGFNRVLLEESTLSLPKNKPSDFVSARHFEKEIEGDALQPALRATWGTMADPQIVGYNLMGKGPQGNSVPLNNSTLSSTSFEAPLQSLRAKGISDTTALSVQGVLDGGGIIDIDPIPRPVLKGCKGDGGGGTQTAPTAPQNLDLDNLSAHHGGPKVYMFWEPGFVAGATYQIFRAISSGLLCSTRDQYELIATTPDLWFVDIPPSLNTQYGYQIQAVSADGTLVSSMSACRAVSTYPENFHPPANPMAINTSTLGTLPTRQVAVSWTGDSLSGKWAYKIARATRAVEPGLKPCATFADGDYVEVGQSTDPSFTDTVFGTDANPLVAYRVALSHEYVGLVSSWSDCAMTHVGTCATRPPAPGYPGSPHASYDAQHNTVDLTWAQSTCAGCSIQYWVYLGDLRIEAGTLYGSTTQVRYTVPVIWPLGGNFHFSIVAVDNNTGCRSVPGVVWLVIPPNGGCAPPPAPSQLDAEVQGTRVRLSWSEVPNCIYRIFRAEGSCVADRALWRTTSGTALYDTLSIGSTASYSVRAVLSSNWCESTTQSPCATATVPPPGPPTNLAVTEVFLVSGQYLVQLSWDPVDGALGYGIYRRDGSCENPNPPPFQYLGATATVTYTDPTFTTPDVTMSYAVTAFFEGSYETPKSVCEDYMRPGTSSTSGLPPMTYYYVWDHLGSTRVVLNAIGEIVETHDFEPFGVELPPLQDETGNTHKFTGQERDAATGLDYFHARMMASSFGRFTSPDKVGVNAERMMSPQRLNQYVYAANNPVKYYDPNGLDIQLFVRDNSGGGDGNYGHVAIRVYGQGYDYTYDFGRYRLVRGAFNQEGEGIMRVWKDSEAFKKTQQPEGKLTTVDIPTTLTQDKAVMDFFNKETSAGTQLRESPARTIYKLTADYNYKSNNCVTQSLQGLGKIFSVPPLQQNMSGLTQAGFNVIKDDWKPMQVLEDLPEVKQQSPGVTIRGLVPSM